jgi:dethiobiotin synthetase
MSLFFITGTDTDAGKTVATCQLMRSFAAAGKTVVAMKPVASGCIWQDGELVNTDAQAHAAAANVTVDQYIANPYRFEPPISPHLAARAAGVEVSLLHLLDCAQGLQRAADVVLIEGAGGWYAPLTDTLTMADLAVEFAAPVILVVGMKLGCLNHARLSAEAIIARGLPLAGWIANRLDPDMACYAENMDYLRAQLPMPLLAEIPHQPAALQGALPAVVARKLLNAPEHQPVVVSQSQYG